MRDFRCLGEAENGSPELDVEYMDNGGSPQIFGNPMGSEPTLYPFSTVSASKGNSSNVYKHGKDDFIEIHSY